MANWVAATEESTTVTTGGALPGRRGSGAEPAREPAGTWHAADADTGRIACGSSRFMEVWQDRPWATPGVTDRCADCVAAAPLPD